MLAVARRVMAVRTSLAASGALGCPPTSALHSRPATQAACCCAHASVAVLSTSTASNQSIGTSSSFSRLKSCSGVGAHLTFSTRTSRSRLAATTSGEGATAQLPELLYGQVISASVGFVKVELHDPDTQLGPDGTLLFSRDAQSSSSSSSSSSRADAEEAVIEAAEGAGAAGQGASSSAGAHGDEPHAQHTQRKAQLLPRRQLLCNVRSLLRKLSKKVLVGDHVQVCSIDWTHGRGSVQDVLPRHSELVDPAVANVDHALLVFALEQPPFEELQVSKFLVSMEASDLPFTLVLNKVDLVSEAERQHRTEQVRGWGYEPILVSCATGQGLQQLTEALAGRTSVVAGPSGAGKSSIINALRLGRHRPDQEPLLDLPAEFRLPPADVIMSQPSSAGSDSEAADSKASSSRGAGAAAAGEAEVSSVDFLVVGEMSRMGRGMHTTTSVTLIKLQGDGMLADTPGFSQPSLSKISSQELSVMFPEMREAMERQPCRFSNCIHLMEPGCSINSGSQAMERYPMYVKMLMEIKAREDTDIKVIQQAKQQREGASKIKTGKGGKQRVEAKLDARKHRGGSRQQARLGMLDALDE